MASEEADLCIRNARVVTPTETVLGGVAADDGRIVTVGADASLPAARTEIDAEGKYLIPGIIDPHVHLGRRTKGYPEQLEIEFETESRGAIHGGVTTFINFIEQGDPYLPDLDFFTSVGEEQSYIDFTHHWVMSHDHHVDEIDELAAEGYRTFKLFFNMYKHMDIDIEPSEADRVYRVLQEVADMNYGLALFHAENSDLSHVCREEVRASGRHGMEAWTDTSPPVSEAMQIDHVGRLTEFTNSHTYIVHISSAEGADTLARYQDRGIDIHGETLVAFLALTHEDDLGVWGKISPPIRGEANQERLWDALRTGTIDHVGTDHISTDRTVLENGNGQHGSHFWDSPPGLQPGVEYFLPVMLSEGVNRNRLSMERLVEVCSTNNAKQFGLYPRKGALVPGADADMVIVDLNKSTTVDDDFYHTRETSWSPFHGRELTGLPTHTIVDGELAVAEGDLFVEPGRGSFLPVYDDGVPLSE
jgi:dihydropyrimidinase/dihydroorotase